VTDELTVGVLGGLGPEATLDFLAKVLALSEARRDQDHLHLIVDMNPKVPNRHDAVAGIGPPCAPALAAMARRLEAAGADFLVMPCSTAHAFAPEVAAAVRIPLVSIVAETLDTAQSRVPRARRLGLLAADGSRVAKLYETAIVARGLAPVTTDEAEQAVLMGLLYAIKAGERSDRVRAGLRHLGDRLIARGAETVIAACTEVPLVLFDGDLATPLIDSTAALAEATVAYAKHRRPLPGH
jgi:aspartate racemase